MTSQLIDIGKLNICYETFGSPQNEAVLLIMGTGLQGVLWSNDFCNDLANHQLYVIRYDHRDTGLSTCFNFEEQPYTSNDLANDALKLLDKLHISKAHLVGMSMGGHIVQLVAINHPERLLSATMIMTSPYHVVFLNAVAGNDTPRTNLPKPSQEVIRFFLKPQEDLENREKSINYGLAMWKLYNGNKTEFDEKYWRILVAEQFDRTQNFHARTNHRKACAANPEDRTQALQTVEIPTLIIHGTEDPIFPLAHGQALAKAIKNSKLLIIDKMGHALNPLFQNQMIAAICGHIRSII